MLELGDQGEAVRELQEALDIPWLLVDGHFGPATDHAVRAFQCTYGLTVDGIVGPETWIELL